MQPASVIDMQSLKELTGGDDSFMAEMIEIYLRNTPIMLLEMTNSFTRHDIEKLKQTAHKIKSSLGMMGMSDAWHLAEEIEKTGEKSFNKNSLEEKLKKLSEFITASETELKQELKKLRK